MTSPTLNRPGETGRSLPVRLRKKPSVGWVLVARQWRWLHSSRFYPV